MFIYETVYIPVYYVERKGMKRQGRVSHVSAAVYGNMLLVAGGYSGYVRGDLIAFKFLTHVAPPSVSTVTIRPDWIIFMLSDCE